MTYTEIDIDNVGTGKELPTIAGRILHTRAAITQMGNSLSVPALEWDDHHQIQCPFIQPCLQ